MIGLSVAEATLPHDVRAVATARLATLGTPSTAWEDWRYVRGATMPATTTASPSVANTKLTGDIVLSQGSVVRAPQLPDGITWTHAKQHDESLRDSLAHESDPSACLAVALAPQHYQLDITKSSSTPMTITLGQSGVGGALMSISLAAGVSASIILDHQLTTDAWSLPRIELTLARGAQLTVAERANAIGANLIAMVSGTIAQDATLRWTSWSTGGRLVRLAQRFTLSERGAHIDLAGAARLTDDVQLHHFTRVIHGCGDTTSEQHFRVLLDGSSVRSFDGLVHMGKGVEGANAEQQDRNLVLSAKARADARPQLDIRTDDVKAAHGAAIGQLDAEQLLYLRMRGLDTQTARSLLTDAFIAEITDRLPVEVRP